MWKHRNTHAIGGLQEVGFQENHDLLLVLSSQGEGIFDCISGEILARNNNDYDWWKRYNTLENNIPGFGILENHKIKISGLELGDTLLKSTSDFWKLSVEREFTTIEDQKIILSYRGSEKSVIAVDGPCEFRAYGFSPTENSLIVASSCELVIYSRE